MLAALPSTPSSAAFNALLAHRLPQVFAFAFGTPVDPDVKPIATTCAAAREGIATASAPASSCGAGSEK